MFKRLTSILLWLLAMTPLICFGSTSPLSVTLRSSSSGHEAEMGIVILTVTNVSDRALLILKADSALLTDEEHLMNDVMNVVAADGKPVAYRGRASRPAVSNREAYWTIEPGEIKTSRIDLPANYDVEGGQYSVSYTQRYLELDEFNPDGAPWHESNSNSLSIYANERLISGKKTDKTSASVFSATAPGPDSTCADTAENPQKTIINNARSTASSWAFFGASDIGDLYIVSHHVDTSGKIVWKAVIDKEPDYTTWFGAPQDTSPLFSEPPTREQVWDQGDFLPLHVTRAIWSRTDNVDSFSCGCAAAYDASLTPAWTEESRTHICNTFWRLPFSTYGVDNQVLTIVHENAHHADTFGPYVGDHQGAYGRAPAKAFALANREKALVNADNYAYYVEARRMKKDKLSAAPPLLPNQQSDVTRAERPRQAAAETPAIK